MDSLVLIKEYIPNIQIDLRYGTTDNITGHILYPEARAYLNRDAVIALAKVQAILSKSHLSLKIWDAYRPLEVSKKLWEATPKSEKQYVADPCQGSVHNRGCAVDLTLYDTRTQRDIVMPSGFDDFSERAWPEFKDAPKEQLKERDLLHSLMESHGFVIEPDEWWHFNWHDWEKYSVLDTPIEAL